MTAATIAIEPEELLGLTPSPNWRRRTAAGSPPRRGFVAPDGIAQLTLTSDLPDPYHR
jgi:hypothetical protein